MHHEIESRGVPRTMPAGAKQHHQLQGDVELPGGVPGKPVQDRF